MLDSITRLLSRHAGTAAAWLVTAHALRLASYITARLQRHAEARQRTRAAKNRRTSKQQQAPAAASAAQKPQQRVQGPPGKSVKQLLKESRAAAGRAAAHEHLPDSEFLVASLRGHDGAITSVDISQDNTRIMTACKDDVRCASCPFATCAAAVARRAQSPCGFGRLHRCRCWARCCCALCVCYLLLGSCKLAAPACSADTQQCKLRYLALESSSDIADTTPVVATNV